MTDENPVGRLHTADPAPRPAVGKAAVENVVTVLGGHVVKLVLLLASGVLIPRALGPDRYGQLAAVTAIASMVQVVATFGLIQTAFRFLPPLWHSEDRSEAESFVSTVWLLRLVIAPIAGVVGAVWIAGTVGSELGLTVVVALGFLCALLPATEAAQGLFMPLDRAREFVGYGLLYVGLRLPVVLVSFHMWGLTGVFLALPLLQAGIFTIVTTSLRRVVAVSRNGFDLSLLRPHLFYGATSWLDSLCIIVQVQFATYAVALWVGPREAGILAVAMMAFTTARGPVLAALSALMPSLTLLHSTGDDERLQAWSELVVTVTVTVYAVGLVVWVALGDRLASLLFGPGFADVYPTLTLLLASTVFFVGAATLHLQLLIHQRAGLALANTVVHSLAILSGLAILLPESGSRAPSTVALVHLVASLLFAATTSGSLAVAIPGLALQLKRVVVIALPALLYAALAALRSEWRFAALFVPATWYVGTMLVLFRSRSSELRELLAALRGMKRQAAHYGAPDLD